MSDIEAVYEAERELGNQARAFLDSPLGQYVKGYLEQEIQEAKDAFEETDPTDATAISGLQDRIKRARLVQSAFGELIQRGIEATSILEENRNE